MRKSLFAHICMRFYGPNDGDPTYNDPTYDDPAYDDPAYDNSDLYNGAD